MFAQLLLQNICSFFLILSEQYISIKSFTQVSQVVPQVYLTFYSFICDLNLIGFKIKVSLFLCLRLVREKGKWVNLVFPLQHFICWNVVIYFKEAQVHPSIGLAAPSERVFLVTGDAVVSSKINHCENHWTIFYWLVSLTKVIFLIHIIM